ncbi:hypothetical protein A8O28_04465 [Enterobacteriaceae bacterium CCUG 67584]|nr:hypothetical protein [Enterobacteriaceae bacterium CCUG 67584]
MSDKTLQVVAITCMDSFYMRGMDIRPGKLQEAFNLQLEEPRSVEDMATTAAEFFADSGRMIFPLVDVTGAGKALALALQVKGYDVFMFNPAALCEPAHDAQRFLNHQAKGGHLYNEGVMAGCITYVDDSAPQEVELNRNESGQLQVHAKSGETRLSCMLGWFWHGRIQELTTANWSF